MKLIAAVVNEEVMHGDQFRFVGTLWPSTFSQVDLES